MPKAAATAASNAATTMRNTARAITLPRQRAGRRPNGLIGCIAEFSALCLSRPPDASVYLDGAAPTPGRQPAASAAPPGNESLTPAFVSSLLRRSEITTTSLAISTAPFSGRDSWPRRSFTLEDRGNRLDLIARIDRQ